MNISKQNIHQLNLHGQIKLLQKLENQRTLYQQIYAFNLNQFVKTHQNCLKDIQRKQNYKKCPQMQKKHCKNFQIVIVRIFKQIMFQNKYISKNIDKYCSQIDIKNNKNKNNTIECNLQQNCKGNIRSTRKRYIYQFCEEKITNSKRKVELLTNENKQHNYNKISSKYNQSNLIKRKNKQIYSFKNSCNLAENSVFIHSGQTRLSQQVKRRATIRRFLISLSSKDRYLNNKSRLSCGKSAIMINSDLAVNFVQQQGLCQQIKSQKNNLH